MQLLFFLLVSTHILLLYLFVSEMDYSMIDAAIYFAKAEKTSAGKMLN